MSLVLQIPKHIKFVTLEDMEQGSDNWRLHDYYVAQIRFTDQTQI